MAYRWNGVECDTFEELQRLQGSARTTSAMVKDKETSWQKYCREKGMCGKSVGNDEHCDKKANHAGDC